MNVTGFQAQTCNAGRAALDCPASRAAAGAFLTQLKNCPTTAVTECVLATNSFYLLAGLFCHKTPKAFSGHPFVFVFFSKVRVDGESVSHPD